MRTWAACLMLLLLASPAGASPIVLSGSAVWNGTAGAFWNNPSYDRNGCANVGIFLLAAPCSDVPGFYTNSPRLTYLEWLGEGSTTFHWDADWNPVELLRVSDWSAVDQLARLADGALQFTTPAGVWRSDTLDAGRSHFALFRSGGSYYLGLEDATWTTRRPADWDYNDTIVRISNAPVPEPGSLLLVGGGLCALARAARRRGGNHD